LLTKIHAAYLLEAINMWNSHALEFFKNKFLNIFKYFDKAETRGDHFQGTQSSWHIQPVTNISLDRYKKM
jgi:hypothetical protein